MLNIISTQCNIRTIIILLRWLTLLLWKKLSSDLTSRWCFSDSQMTYIWIYVLSNICAQLWRDYLKFILFCSENCCPKKNRERILKRRNFRWVKNYLWRINNWFFVHSFMINKTKYDDTSFLPILGTEESAWIKVSSY